MQAPRDGATEDQVLNPQMPITRSSDDASASRKDEPSRYAAMSRATAAATDSGVAIGMLVCSITLGSDK